MTQRTAPAINSDSSSIKYQLVNPDSGVSLASGLVGRIGKETGAIIHRHGEERTETTESVPDHGFGLSEVLHLLEEQGPSLADAHIVAVGYRVIQGGCYFSGPALIDDDVVARIEQLVPLDPLHNPAHLEGTEVGRRLLPDMPHVTVFDTALFQDLSKEAARYALNREIADAYSVRRYGAHGISYRLVSGAVPELLGHDDLKQVVLRLDNGASASAVVTGRVVNTPISLTPLEGLVMGGRTGDIDPATILHLAHVAGMSIDEIDHLSSRGSGMKSLAGDNDMCEMWKRIGVGRQEARKAMDIYLYRPVKYVGAYTIVMDGLDALTFTAGIGENDVSLRRELGERLGSMSVRISQEVNETRSNEPRVISIPDSKVAVLAVPTNGELAIARQAFTLIWAVPGSAHRNLTPSTAGPG